MSPVATADADQAQLRSTGRLFDPGGRLTLDDLVTACWDAREAAPCLVCGLVIPAAGAEGAAVRCPTCGSRLE